MKKINFVKTAQNIFTAFIGLVFVIAPIATLALTPQEELAAVQKQLADIRNQKGNIQNQINNNKNISDKYTAQILGLQGQITLLDNQIQEKNLVIQELNLQISILTGSIDSTTAEITKAEGDINALESETDKRMVDIYIKEKTNSNLDVFFNQAGNDIIKYSVYQNSFQAETNGLIQDLNSKKDDLNKKKADLEASKLDIVNSQTQLDAEKLALTQTQSTLDQQRASFTKQRNAALQKVTQYSSLYKNMTAQEKKAEEQQEAIMRIIMARTEAGNGVFVKKGQFLGVMGSTGNSTGNHVHFAVMVGSNIYSDTRNPCDYLPYNIYPGNGDDNCDHKGNGSLGVPITPTGRLTSGYKPWYRPSHLGIDVSTTGGVANVIAAHDGYVYYGYENGGWGNFAKVCTVKNCSSGLRTVYAHMKCTAASKGQSGSCQN